MKILYVAFLCCLFGLQNGFAQTELETPHYMYSSAIKISPIDFARSYFEVSYEKYLGDRSHSLVISPTFMLKESNFESFRGFQLEMNYRFFLTHLQKGQNRTMGMYNIGFYAGPFLSGTVYDEDFRWGFYDDQLNEYLEGNYDRKVKAVETGLILGMQLDITPRILLDFYVGGGIRYASDTNNIPEVYKNQYYVGDAVFDIGYTGVKPKLGLQIGFTF